MTRWSSVEVAYPGRVCVFQCLPRKGRHCLQLLTVAIFLSPYLHGSFSISHSSQCGRIFCATVRYFRKPTATEAPQSSRSRFSVKVQFVQSIRVTARIHNLFIPFHHRTFLRESHFYSKLPHATDRKELVVQSRDKQDVLSTTHFNRRFPTQSPRFT